MNLPVEDPYFKPRAVLYLRQSTYREESISLELQETAGRQYCERMGYHVVAVEEDPGISGRTWKRPGVQRVMNMIEHREADAIILWKWSRLSRSRLDWAVAVDKVETAGGRIESATEQVDTTTSTGRLARGMLAEFAAFESERIGEVWKETLHRRITQGVPATGGDRYGYIRVEKDVYEPDPATAPVLIEAYRRYIEEEHGWTRLTRWLNESGARTITGALWSPDKIRAILDSGFAAGVLATGYRSGKLTYFPGRQPRLINPAVWDAYLGRRSVAPRPSRQVNPRSTLSGLLTCDDCDGHMRSQKRSAGVAGYGCSNYLRNRMGRYVTCTKHSVEKYVHDWVAELAEDIDALATAEAQLVQRRVATINDAAGIDKSITRLTEQLGVLTVRYVADKLSEDAFQAASARLQQKIDDLRARKRVIAPGNPVEFDVRRLAISLIELWDQATPLELRTLLSRMIREVRVIPPPVRKRGGTGPVTFHVVPLWEQVVS